MLPIHIIHFDVGIDGLPLFKSSANGLWPILGSLSNVPTIRPFLIEKYVGIKKPLNVNDFLHDFVNELKTINENGIEMEGKKRQLKPRLFVCDAPARAFVSGTVGHSSGIGSSKCYQKARMINRRLTFKPVVHDLRTDGDFEERKDKEHFLNSHHILEEKDINRNTQFPLDVMHLIDMGVTKKILTYIWKGKHKGDKLTIQNKIDMINMLVAFKAYIPKEFKLKPRTFEELCLWKAVEFRLFVLYIGPVILKNFLPDNM